MKSYWIYIITNSNDTVLYTGVTDNIERRLYEHENKLIKGFSSKYNLHKLVYLQEFASPNEAIAAEKRIKGWTRKKKNQLVESTNPFWKNILKNNLD